MLNRTDLRRGFRGSGQKFKTPGYQDREGGFMNRDRLDWVMSGLTQYALTKTEDQFLKTAAADFDKNQALTEGQEKRLETLYKKKSQLAPNKNSDYFSFKESIPQKTRPRRPHTKVF